MVLSQGQEKRLRFSEGGPSQSGPQAVFPRKDFEQNAPSSNWKAHVETYDV